MRKTTLFFVFASILPASARAAAAGENPESISGGSAAAFSAAALRAQAALGGDSAPEVPFLPGAGPVEEAPADEPILERPEVEDLSSGEAAGRTLGSFVLAERLDSHSDLLNLRLGDKDYDLSLASDPNFDKQYLAFRRKDYVLFHKIENPNDLRNAGVVVRLDEKTAYRFKVYANIFSPTRGSTLKITPEPGTDGPPHSMKTGALLDAIERESFIFKTGGRTYWLLYGTDVDPATSLAADSRSFLVIHENGLSSKAWPVAEGGLKPGQPAAVSLGETRVVFIKTPDGSLELREPAKTVPAAAPGAR